MSAIISSVVFNESYYDMTPS